MGRGQNPKLCGSSDWTLEDSLPGLLTQVISINLCMLRTASLMMTAWVIYPMGIVVGTGQASAHVFFLFLFTYFHMCFISLGFVKSLLGIC